MKHRIFLLAIIVITACQNKETKQTEMVVVTQDSVENEQQDSDFNMESFQNMVNSYESPDRGEWQNPQLVLDKFGELSGKTIADIGAGTGYFSFKMAELDASVIAIDIDDRFLNYIDDRKPELDNSIGERIQTRLTKEEDPLLKKGEVNGALMVNTYYFISDRVSYLKKILEGLKPQGALVLVDYKKGEMPVGPQETNKIDENTAIEELKKAGFDPIELDESSLQYQYIITATKP